MDQLAGALFVLYLFIFCVWSAQLVAKGSVPLNRSRFACASSFTRLPWVGGPLLVFFLLFSVFFCPISLPDFTGFYRGRELRWGPPIDRWRWFFPLAFLSSVFLSFTELCRSRFGSSLAKFRRDLLTLTKFYGASKPLDRTLSRSKPKEDLIDIDRLLPKLALFFLVQLDYRCIVGHSNGGKRNPFLIGRRKIRASAMLQLKPSPSESKASRINF